MVRLGIVLIRVVCWASEQLSRSRRRPADYLRVFAAYGGLAMVTIGLVVDWLPLGNAITRSSTTHGRPGYAGPLKGSRTTQPSSGSVLPSHSR